MGEAARFRRLATRRSHSLDCEEHSRTYPRARTARPALRLITSRIIVGIRLAQTTKAGCCENPARLSTPLTWREESLTNANVPRRPHCPFKHSSSYFWARPCTSRSIVNRDTKRKAPRTFPPEEPRSAKSLLVQSLGRHPKNSHAFSRQLESAFLC